MHTPIQRREILYNGMVQGVGFRFSTRRMAQRFDVTGFVMNLPDGRVKLVVEGTPKEIERFLGDIESELGGYIAQTEQDTQPATGELRSFEIRL